MGLKSFPLDGQWVSVRIVVIGLFARAPSPYQPLDHQGKDDGFLGSYIAILSGRRPLVKGCLEAVVNVSGAVMSTAC